MRFLRWLGKYTSQGCRFLSSTQKTSLFQLVLPKKLQELLKVCLLEYLHPLDNLIENQVKISFFIGKYYYLPNASDAVISATTKEALSALKNSWFLAFLIYIYILIYQPNMGYCPIILVVKICKITWTSCTCILSVFNPLLLSSFWLWENCWVPVSLLPKFHFIFVTFSLLRYGFLFM